MHRFVWIDPNFFDLYPNSIQTGGVVQFCHFLNNHVVWCFQSFNLTLLRALGVVFYSTSVTPPDMAALVTVSMDYSLTPAVIQVLLDQDLRFSTRRYRALKLTEFWVTLPLGSPFYLDFVLPGGQELKP